MKTIVCGTAALAFAGSAVADTITVCHHHNPGVLRPESEFKWD